MGLTGIFTPRGLNNKAQGREAHPGYRMRNAKRTPWGFHMESRAGVHNAIRCGGDVEPRWGSKNKNGR